MRLERQLRITQAVLAAFIIGAIGIAAMPQEQQKLKCQELTIEDPSGRGSPIVLRASPESSGMWIGDGDVGNVAIYRTSDQAVIGAYGHSNTDLDVAMATGKSGPAFQLSNDENKHVLTPANWKPGGTNTDYKIRFVPNDPQLSQRSE